MRGLGEGARMSDQDIEQAVSSIDMAGLSPDERAAIVKSFANFAISQMDEKALGVLTKDKISMQIINALGINVPNMNTGDSANSESGKIPPGMKMQKNKRTGETRLVPIGG
jgi:acyl-CoA reductase-like NAD-dependent aldehyde dehydrogenase